MNTAERVVDILDAVASADGPCGVSELSRQLKIGKNNIFRILSALEDKGWIEQDTETKKYSLTGAMAEVAFRALSQLDIQKIGLPYLHELQQMTGETSALVIRVELERTFISSVPSNQSVRHVVPVGERRELWRGSGGKAILAFMTEDEIEAVLRQFSDTGVSVLAAGQVVTVESLRAELAQIRNQASRRSPENAPPACVVCPHPSSITTRRWWDASACPVPRLVSTGKKPSTIVP